MASAPDPGPAPAWSAEEEVTLCWREEDRWAEEEEAMGSEACRAGEREGVRLRKCQLCLRPYAHFVGTPSSRTLMAEGVHSSKFNVRTELDLPTNSESQTRTHLLRPSLPMTNSHSAPVETVPPYEGVLSPPLAA